MRHPLREDDPNAPAARLEPPPMDHSIGGWKWCQYSPQTARIILARIEAGETVRQVAADPAMPSYRTLYDWLDRIPEFADAYNELRRERARARREEIARREQGARADGRRKAGRKSTWTFERGEAFCDLIFQGLSTRAACARPGMPDPPMVHRWLRNHPEFRARYLTVVQIRDFRLCDQVIDLSLQANPANWRTLKARAKRLQAKISAMRPAVWRWD
jgi:GrpB-like predicted nucleotidyltransferase (UPF0157 family)